MKATSSAVTLDIIRAKHRASAALLFGGVLLLFGEAERHNNDEIVGHI